MALSLFRKPKAAEPVYSVYGALVAQSRQPRFYAEWGVPDTVTGRFDMISLHMALLFRRLRAEKPEGRAFSQALFDLFFKDMDRSLREMGAGDLAVPKKIRNMGNLFYGLLASLDAALDSDDPAQVEAVLARNVFAAADNASVSRLAHYVIAASRGLDGQAASAIMAGQIEMGLPA